MPLLVSSFVPLSVCDPTSVREDELSLGVDNKSHSDMSVLGLIMICSQHPLCVIVCCGVCVIV